MSNRIRALLAVGCDECPSPQDIEALLIAACEEAMAIGYALAPFQTLDEQACRVDPLSALVLNHDRLDLRTVQNIEHTFDIDKRVTYTIAAGWHQDSPENWALAPYAIGQRLRDRFGAPRP